MNGKSHAVLLAIAGAYVLYQAYEILKDYVNGAGSMTDTVTFLSVSVLGLGGLAVLFYAWVTYKRSKTEDEDQEREKEEQAVK